MKSILCTLVVCGLSLLSACLSDAGSDAGANSSHISNDDAGVLDDAGYSLPVFLLIGAEFQFPEEDLPAVDAGDIDDTLEDSGVVANDIDAGLAVYEDGGTNPEDAGIFEDDVSTNPDGGNTDTEVMIGTNYHSLYFSEYIHSNSSGKALEIFNSGEDGVILDECEIRYYNNGNTEMTSIPMNLNPDIEWCNSDGVCFNEEQEQLILLPGKVFTICDLNISGTAQCDERKNGLPYGGDDVVALVCELSFYDVIGQIGNSPYGSAWQNNGVSTKGQSLTRKCEVVQGDNDPYNEFDPSVEWDNWIVNTHYNLGHHCE